jgi:hypothetical protein
VNPRQRGPLVAGTWLIGLGVVFLLRQSMGLSWSEAWPLFVILVGVASFVSTILDWRPGATGLWSFTWPVVWIVVGVLLLLSTTGQLGTEPGELIEQGWPWLLVALGVWFLIGAVFPGGSKPQEQLVVPLRAAGSASVRVKFGAGSLTTRPAALGALVDGEFRGGVVHRERGPGVVELEQDTTWGLPWLNQETAWTLGLTREVPIELKIETGASRARLDLRDLKLRRLELKTGASESTVVLPGAAGATDVRAEAGAASLTFIVPTGVGARIKSKMALGSNQIDETLFPRMGDGFQSPDYASAENRVDLEIQGGVGSVRIRGGD